MSRRTRAPGKPIESTLRIGGRESLVPGFGRRRLRPGRGRRTRGCARPFYCRPRGGYPREARRRRARRRDRGPVRKARRRPSALRDNPPRPSRRRRPIPVFQAGRPRRRSPDAQAARVAARSPSNSARMAWASGSPKRQLYSSTFGPEEVTMMPAYRTPDEGRALGGQVADYRVDARYERILPPASAGRRELERRRPCRRYSGRGRRPGDACGPGRSASVRSARRRRRRASTLPHRTAVPR